MNIIIFCLTILICYGIITFAYKKYKNIDIMEKTIVKVLANFGITDPKKMQRMIFYAEDCMKNKRDMKQGFFTGVGGHVLLFLTNIAALYFMAAQGLFS